MKPTILVFFVVLLAMAVISDVTDHSSHLDNKDAPCEYSEAPQHLMPTNPGNYRRLGPYIPANHHKKHMGNNVKADEYYTTYQPTDVTFSDGGDFEWLDRAHVRNVELPKAFGPGRSDITPTEMVSAKHHGKSKHGSHSR